MKPIRGGLLSGVALALLLALFPAISSATFPGVNGRIAYNGVPDGDPFDDLDIYTVLPDGTDPQPLTTSPLTEYAPAWSADGKRLAFTRFMPSGGQVFTIRADGSDETQATHERTYALDPYFSPNGRRIVYTAERDYASAIFKIRTDGTERRRVVKGGVFDPAFGPGGKRITFAGHPEGRGDGIWTVRPDGSHLRRLTKPGPCCYERAPDFNPDGRHIAFSRCTYDVECDDCDLYLMRADGTRERSILHLGYGTLIYGLAYAPAGDLIALSVSPSGPVLEPVHNVATVTRNGSDRQLVTNKGDNPSWQPIPAP